MRKTRSFHEPPRPPRRAAGLHVSETRKDYYFDDIGKGTVTARYILFGRGRTCHIRIDDSLVSGVHATLERKGLSIWLQDESSNGATFVDGRPVKEPVELLIGMRVQLAG